MVVSHCAAPSSTVRSGRSANDCCGTELHHRHHDNLLFGSVRASCVWIIYEGWNFNSGKYLDTMYKEWVKVKHNYIIIIM